MVRRKLFQVNYFLLTFLFCCLLFISNHSSVTLIPYLSATKDALLFTNSISVLSLSLCSSMATPIEAPKASSSSSEFKFDYDIFLSFQGLDTREKFADPLYHALNRAGFRTFRDDDEIRRSENINSELQRAIKYSKMSVIVFSEDYASSNACLFEVQTILEHCKKSDHFILPVFYDVDPGRVKEQARDLEKKDSSEKTKRRSAALKEVASMTGMVLQNQADGCEFVGHAKNCLPQVSNGNFPFFPSDSPLFFFLQQDMGKQIVCRESDYPQERSRIWRHKESFNILNEKDGTKKIEGLTFDLNVLKKDEFETVHRSGFSHEHPKLRNSKVVNIETNAFEKMCNLRLLKLSCVQLSGTYEVVPKRLRWLYWRSFSSEYIPYGFPMDKMVVLEMRYSNLKQVWKGAKVLGSLKMLNVSHSPKLAKTPDFSGIPCLEKLILKDCPSLVEVDESIVKLQRIFLLNLRDCKNLRKLPRNISMVESLEELNISGCSNLIGAVEELKKMRSLRVLHANRMNINQLLTMKVESQASFWPWIPKPRKSIQMSLAALPSSLVHLSLAHCNLTDDAFPRDLGLQTLDLSWCPKLQYILWPAITLEKLVVSECRKLEKISYETSGLIKSITHGACMSLDYVQRGFKISPVAKVDAELLNNIGFFNLDLMANDEAFIVNRIVWSRKKCPIQILYEYIVFSTYFPGREVPHWFSNKNAGSTLTFTMTSSPRCRIQGVNLCLVYTVPEDIDWLPSPFHVNISNKSRDIETVYTPRCYGIPEVGGDMVWLSHWLPETLFKEGDEVQIMFGLNVDGQIKECGVHILYVEEEEEIFQYYKTIHYLWDSNMFEVVSVADAGQDHEQEQNKNEKKNKVLENGYYQHLS
ncbi:disease resistance protein RUN1-like isoform X2 [Actinidia eriantha]|uniref:disease resistance protein RUN1-like isoform X2 n=1 Tax=Actinidia eriantha TaxID=165200 RepID=UPI002589C064|nr:disease resistance protein RUN1-like isoform X2 [Actinidia eriantha]